MGLEINDIFSKIRVSKAVIEAAFSFIFKKVLSGNVSGNSLL